MKRVDFLLFLQSKTFAVEVLVDVFCLIIHIHIGRACVFLVGQNDLYLRTCIVQNTLYTHCSYYGCLPDVKCLYSYVQLCTLHIFIVDESSMYQFYVENYTIIFFIPCTSFSMQFVHSYFVQYHFDSRHSLTHSLSLTLTNSLSLTHSLTLTQSQS